MSKYLKLLIRIFITLFILFIILFTTENLLKLKKKLSEKEWSWTKENKVINKMLIKKYQHDDYPIVINKNTTIPPKEKEEKRILVVGDSFVWGYGHSNVNYTWWKQLNQKIHEEGYTNVNVYGAGYWGYNTEDELNNILNNDQLISKIDPDLIIMGYVYNDPEQRDSKGNNIIPDSWEPKNTLFYQLFPNLNDELGTRISYKFKNYPLLLLIGKIFGYRWDVRTRLLTEGESIKYYEKVLKKVDKRIKKLNIPYFYYFNVIHEDSEVNVANENIHRLMDYLDIDNYYYPLPLFFDKKIEVNPEDSHPGIVVTNYYGNDVYHILRKNFSFIFNDRHKKESLNFKLNINDTMPYLDLHQLNYNTYEFVYPKEERKRTIDSNFLYYPINKNYIKLNLEYPKKISKVKITSENTKLNTSLLYVNTFNEQEGYDLEGSMQKLTKCEQINNDTFIVNQKITSLNISTEFMNEEERKIKIELIEE